VSGVKSQESQNESSDLPIVNSCQLYHLRSMHRESYFAAISLQSVAPELLQLL
jgi:hypothetical protein